MKSTFLGKESTTSVEIDNSPQVCESTFSVWIGNFKLKGLKGVNLLQEKTQEKTKGQKDKRTNRIEKKDEIIIINILYNIYIIIYILYKVFLSCF